MSQRFSYAAVLMVLASCLSLQFGAALAVQLFPAMGTWGATALRLTIAGVLLLAITRPKIRSWGRRTWIAVAVFGATFVGMTGMFYQAVERLPLGTTVAIEFLGPLVLAAVLSRTAKDLIWVGLALAGMVVLGVGSILDGAPLDPIGVLFALAAGAAWAAYILAGARVTSLVPGSGGLAVAVLVGAILVLPAGVGAAGAVVASPHLILLGLACAVLASVLPYSLEFAALRRLPRNVFGVLLSLEPAAAALAGFILLHQSVTLTQWITITLVMTASVGITLTAAARARSAQPPAELAADVTAVTAPIPLPPRRTGRTRSGRRQGRAAARP